jgi:hypothetical protein
MGPTYYKRLYGCKKKNEQVHLPVLDPWNYKSCGNSQTDNLCPWFMQNLNLDGFELLFTIFICFNLVIMRTSIFISSLVLTLQR